MMCDWPFTWWTDDIYDIYGSDDRTNSIKHWNCCPSVLDTVGSVIWPVNIVPYMTYNVCACGECRACVELETVYFLLRARPACSVGRASERTVICGPGKAKLFWPVHGSKVYIWRCCVVNILDPCVVESQWHCLLSGSARCCLLSAAKNVHCTGRLGSCKHHVILICLHDTALMESTPTIATCSRVLCPFTALMESTPTIVL